MVSERNFVRRGFKPPECFQLLPLINAQPTSPVLFQSIPDVAVEIIIAAKEEAAALGERNRRDAADDVVVRVHANLLVSTNVKQQASCIVQPGRKCKSTRKELHAA